MHREATTVSFGDSRLPERFWSKVEVQPDGCWLWMGAKTFGYGTFWAAGRTRRSHRHAYSVLVGDPGDLPLDHLCRVRPCVNPAHLELVTNRENILRGVGATAQNARKTHCQYGHPLSGSNLYAPPHRPEGRECMECHRRWSRDYRARQRKTA